MAASIAFLMADGTSFALPMPKPTTPWPSPMTTSALKLRFLPPLTTFVTRLMRHDRVLQLEFGRVDLFARCAISDSFIELELELQPGLARRVGDRAHAAVIQIAAAVEHDAA